MLFVLASSLIVRILSSIPSFDLTCDSVSSHLIRHFLAPKSCFRLPSRLRPSKVIHTNASLHYNVPYVGIGPVIFRRIIILFRLTLSSTSMIFIFSHHTSHSPPAVRSNFNRLVSLSANSISLIVAFLSLLPFCTCRSLQIALKQLIIMISTIQPGQNHFSSL